MAIPSISLEIGVLTVADKEISFKVRLAIGNAIADAQRVKQTIESIAKTPANNKAAQDAARQQIQQQQRVTQNQKSQIQAQVQSMAAGQQRMAQAAQQAANTQIQQQGRVTAQFQTEIEKRKRAQDQLARQQTGSGGIGSAMSGTLGRLGGAIAGGAAAYLGVQSAQTIAQQAVAMTDLATKAIRAEAAFRSLSGGASLAEKNLRAIENASGGTISRLQAMETGVQALTLGLAKTPAEFEKVTRAAMAVTQVSPIISDISSAFSEIGLASANESFRRLDQLGLTVEEVRNKIAELRSENSELSASQAFQVAVVDTLNVKYADLLDSAEAQATGMERLRVAAENARLELAKGLVMPVVNAAAGAAATGITAITSTTQDAAANWDVLFGTVELENAISRIKSLLDPQTLTAHVGALTDSLVGKEVNTQELERVIEVFEQLGEAQVAQIPNFDTYESLLARIATQASRNNGLTDENARKLELLSGALERATEGTKNFNEAQAATAQREHDITKLVDTFRQIDTLVADVSALTPAQLPGVEQVVQDLLALKIEIASAGGATEEQSAALAEMSKFVSNAFAGITFLSDAENAAAVATGKLNAALVNSPGYMEAAAIQALRMGTALQKAIDIAADLSGGLESQLASMVQEGTVSVDEAIELYKKQQKFIRDTADSVANSGVTTQDQTFAIAAARGALQEELRIIEEAAKARRESNRITLDEQQAFYRQIDDMLNRSQRFDGNMLPGAEKMRQDLINLRMEIAQTGKITDQQRQALSDMDSSLNSAANAVGFLSNAQIQAAIASGNLNSALMTIPGYLDAVKIAAWQTSAAIQDVFAISNRMSGTAQARLENLVRQGVITPGQAETVARRTDVLIEQQSRAIGYSGKSDREQAFAEAAAEQVTFAQIQAIEDNARAREEADRKAAQEAERAFKGAAKAAGDEFKDLAADLRAIPGLFGTTDVTEEDMLKTKLGIYEEKPDEWLRRLRDEVENGKDYEGVSIEQAREALERVGIKAAESAEGVLLQIEEAWNSGVLFADKANLSLLNEEAVRMQLDLQEKAKQGQANIMEHFGVVVDGAVAAVTGSGVTPPPPPKIEIPEVETDPRVFADLIRPYMPPTMPTYGMGLIGAPPKPADAQQLAADGGSFSIDQITLAPNLGADIAADIATQLSEQESAFSGQGGGIAMAIEAGFKEYQLSNHAQTYYDVIRPQFSLQVPQIKGIGGGIAMAIEAGYGEYVLSNHAQTYYDVIRPQFSLKVPDHKGLGGGVAMAIEAGYKEYAWTDMAGEILGELETQFAVKETIERAWGVGGTVASELAHGMTTIDYAVVAKSILTSLNGGFNTEENFNFLYASAGGLMNIIRDGMRAEASKPGWAQSLFNDMMSALLDAASDSIEAEA